MVTIQEKENIEENALIITLPHPCPADALMDLQVGIIAVIKYQCEYYDTALGLEEKLLDGNILLLQLLEATLTVQGKALNKAAAEKEQQQNPEP